MPYHATRNQIISTVTSKGQVTIPAVVRRHLGVGKNDKISFAIESRDKVTLTVPRYASIAKLAGAAGKLKKPLSWEEMRSIAYEDRAHRRS